MLTPSADLVVAGPIMLLAVRVAAASWEASLAVSPSPFRSSITYSRSPFELPLLMRPDRTAEGEPDGSSDTGRGAAPAQP